MRFIICSSAVRDAILGENDEDFRVEPRLIDRPSAVIAGAGNVSAKFVVAERVRDDPAFDRWSPMLDGLPSYEVEPGTLFLPPTMPS